MLDSAFNIDFGYLEGICRGFKNGILKQTDYLNLVQCETLDGMYSLTYMMILKYINNTVKIKNRK